MKTLTENVRQLLKTRGHDYLREDRPPRAVIVRQKYTALLAELQFSKSCHQLVIKQIPETAPGICCPRQLYEVHERLRCESSRLALTTPRFLGFDLEQRLVMMEYVPGPTLLSLLRKALGIASGRRDACASLIEQAGLVLAELHRFSAAELGVPHRRRRNDSFLTDFERMWCDPLVTPFLPDYFQDPQRLYQMLSPSFAGRDEPSLLLADCQPKNILIPEPDTVSFIDLEYVSGNPAIGVAQFLVNLDRLGLRYPWGRALDRISNWKQRFLNSYLQEAAPFVAEDVIFFYPWMLLQVLQQHARSRPWLRWYLVRYYGRRLADFLTTLQRIAPVKTENSVATLFVAC